MKIGIMVSVNQGSGGIYQYTASMLKALHRWDTSDELTIFTWPDNSLPLDKFIGPKWKIERVDLHIPTRIEDVQPYLTGDGSDLNHSGINEKARNLFSRNGIDLMIYPASQSFSFECGIPYIMAIPDLQHRLQPKFPEVSEGHLWKFREYVFRNGVRYAHGILVDSKVGKEDVLAFYGEYIHSEHVYVLPFLPAYRPGKNGITNGQKEVVRKRYQLPERYLFYPAQFWLHKNHSCLVHAIHQLRAVHKVDTPLILVGSTSVGPKEEACEPVFENLMSLAEQLSIQDLVHYLGYVPDEDMPALYSMATALTMPTFFGPTNIPVLEAWALDCPVLTSDIRGIREQVGDAGILADPKDASSMAAAILRLWTDENLRQVLIDKGHRRLEAYTPDDFSQKLYAIINDTRDRIKADTLASTLNHQGEDLFARGDIEGALNAFTKALEIDPNSATIHNNLGVVLWQSGIQKAMQHFERALEIDPNDKDAILNIEELFKSMGKSDDSKKSQLSYPEKNPDDKEETKALPDSEKRGRTSSYSGKPRIYLDCPVERYGSANGGWTICPTGINPDSVVYSCGTSEDFSFDLALIEKFGVNIHAFDPIPRPMEWINQQKFPEEFKVHNNGIASFDGKTSFNPLGNPEHISHTISESTSAEDKSITVQVLRLPTIMQNLGHHRIDILKMDIWGGEYEVIEDIVNSNIPIDQILVEFHHSAPDVGFAKTRKAIEQLSGVGYKILAIFDNGQKYTFIRDQENQFKYLSSSDQTAVRSSKIPQALANTWVEQFKKKNFRGAETLLKAAIEQEQEPSRAKQLKISLAETKFLGIPWEEINKLLPYNTNALWTTGLINSIRRSEPVNNKDEAIPWYTYPAIEFLEDKISPDSLVFEWGSGNSTLWWAKRAKQVYSIENDRKWHSCIHSTLPDNVRLSLIENEDEYVRAIKGCKQLFDFIIIDGLARYECARMANEYVRKGGVIIFDNSDQNAHRQGVEYLVTKGWKRIDFYGLIPSYLYKNCTSVFFKDEGFLNRGHLPSEKDSCLGPTCAQAMGE